MTRQKKIVCIGGPEHGRYWPGDVEVIRCALGNTPSGAPEICHYDLQVFDGAKKMTAFVLRGLSLSTIIDFLGDAEFQRLCTHGKRPVQSFAEGNVVKREGRAYLVEGERMFGL